MKVSQLFEVKKPAQSVRTFISHEDMGGILRTIKSKTGGSTKVFFTDDSAYVIEVNLNKVHDPELVGATLKHLVKKCVEKEGFGFELRKATVRVSGNGENRWARVEFWVSTQLAEATAAKLDYNSQAQLAHEVSKALADKFGYKEIGTWLYDHAGDEDGPHKGSGNIRVRLPKKNKEDPAFLGKVIAPWLRDNLHKLLKRGVSSVRFRDNDMDSNSDGTTDIWFDFHFQL